MPWSRLPTADARGDGPAPTSLGQVLDAVLVGLGAPSADAIVLIHERWGSVVGEELVAHAQPVSIEDGCLRVVVDSPAWASHLRWSERELLARIDDLVGPGIVTSVMPRLTRS